MGQLEAYGVNEIYLTGIIVGLFGTYIAEEFDSNTFESFKSYFYSAAFAMFSKKSKKIIKSSLIVITNEGAIYNSWTYFGLNNEIHITKLIDNFILWQNISLMDFKVDSHVINLQDRYSW